jgi:hypothetical protein
MTMGRLWGWSLTTTCGDVWYIHRSYNVSHMAREYTNPPHMDIQGELEGNSGVQQQQGTVLETWGESRWELIVFAPQQGGADPATPPTQCWTHQEQHQRDAQSAG